MDEGVAKAAFSLLSPLSFQHLGVSQLTNSMIH
jgi:hypothetical protein